ncbi:lipopolysaccharide heptosyltransferase RfaC [Pokkaliibacter plantistimulans]|nr:lipopolysaccharide heptosyltransferase RfaC [Pokkaliibacter plantistimulans]
MKRVLIVKTSSMGDVIHTLPALTDARQADPSIVFDWVVEEGFSAIPNWHPAVERVIPIAIRRWRKHLQDATTWREWRQYRQELRALNYDAIIDAQGLLKSAFFAARQARGPHFGFDWHSAREPLASLFYDRRLRVVWGQHAVERTRQLFAQALGYRLPDQPGDFGLQQRFPRQHDSQKVVCLHATTRADKHYPEEYWRDVLQRLGAAGFQVQLPWGLKREQQRAQRLAEGLSHVEVLPKLGLTQVAEVLAGARGVIAVDTGLAHLTAALGVPNLMLFGPTDPALVGGYGERQCWLEARQFSAPEGSVVEPEVFRSLTPERVWQRWLQLLEESQ